MPQVWGSLKVQVADGWYEGSATDHVRTFLGIRYAQAPTGALRFAPPMPMPMHDGTWGALTASMPCPQLGSDRAVISVEEDCLTLNVVTPRRWTMGQHLPVMVWFHGGGFTVGDGHQYDPERLVADGNVIVITANSRLGVLAQLGLPGLPGSGDFGLADQLSVLQWAHRNAAAFGGDPDNVTMFGESAGAMSICALLAAPAARGMFAKAILSSGSCASSWPAGMLGPDSPPARPYVPLPVSEEHGAALARALGCPQSEPVECLRALPVQALVERSPEYGNMLAYGTPLLPKDPLIALDDGDLAKVPVVSGFNHDEATAAAVGSSWSAPLSAQRYAELVRAAFGGRAEQVLAEYPAEHFPSPGDAWARVATDAAWACPAMRADGLLARQAPVYSYEFDDTSAPNKVDTGSSGVTIGATHAAELPYLFDVHTMQNATLRPAQQKLAERMVRYWTSFAWRGVPQGDAPWPPLKADSNGPVLRLYPADQPAPSPLAPWVEHECDFWQ